MSREDTVRDDLLATFPALEGRITIARERRLWVEVSREEFQAVLDVLKDRHGFDFCCTITGLDLGEDLGFVYHLADWHGVVLNLRQRVPKSDPTILSITPRYPGVIFYERELVDLLGAKVEGLPPGDRYPLRDDWPEGQYPLRKDWKLEMLPEAWKE
ncbi:MAG: NADH-quinone oxidoreductase subunit C [Deltaproteobacteria bacterium]|nr:NADH-quinone oxidoreductase subunit C [Deltaproteobacteria bacterium]